MSLAVARINDTCTGHQGFISRQAVQGSPDIFLNNRAVHRQNDKWAVHCSQGSCHDGALASGSPTVYVNNLQLGRVTDPVNCGSRVATGSPDVFC